MAVNIRAQILLNTEIEDDDQEQEIQDIEEQLDEMVVEMEGDQRMVADYVLIQVMIKRQRDGVQSKI